MFTRQSCYQAYDASVLPYHRLSYRSLLQAQISLQLSRSGPQERKRQFEL